MGRQPVSVTELNAAFGGLPLPDPGHESVRLTDAVGRACARELIAPYPLPPVPSADLDGFAVASAVAGADYRVTGHSLPGDAPAPAPGAHEAVMVMTGAPLPEACSLLIPREQVTEHGDRIHIDNDQARLPVPRGGRIPEGTRLARAGDRLTPNHINQFARFGIGRVPVTARPLVAVLPTGSELTPLPNRDTPAPFAHYDGNAHLLAALTRAAGGDPGIQPPVDDRVDDMVAALRACGAPLIVTTGGTAMGARDLTAVAIAEAGFEVVVSGLAARPGQRLSVAAKDGQVIVSLPGSPGAIEPLFQVAVAPLVRRMGGHTAWESRWFHAALSAPITAAGELTLLSRAHLEVAAGTVQVTPDPTGNDGLVLLPPGDARIKAGTLLQVLPLPGWPN